MLAGQPDRLEATLMRFDEDKSVEYNYEVGFLEGMRMVLNLMTCSDDLKYTCIEVLTLEIEEQVETVKEMDE
tara:strand:- start:344 stop:559 length:216 start_codon:yes stop_codon:yes gene_type:complete